MASSDPWSNVHKSCAFQRTGSKRRRRALFAVHRGDDDDDEEMAGGAEAAAEGGGGAAPERRGSEEAPAPRRRMRPAVSWMSVKVERRALQEIRNLKESLSREIEATTGVDPATADERAVGMILERADDKLEAVDMSLQSFALHYVSGHSNKRGQGGGGAGGRAGETEETASQSF